MNWLLTRTVAHGKVEKPGSRCEPIGEAVL
jgi:hypothetical protein